MTRYHCPFCAPAPAYHRTAENGEQVCGYCGDSLLRRESRWWRQLAAFAAAGALVAPLLAVVWLALQRPQNPKPHPAQQRLASTWVAERQAPVAS